MAMVPTAEQAALDGSRVLSGVFLRRVRCALTDAVDTVNDYDRLDHVFHRGALQGFNYDHIYDDLGATCVGRLAGTNRGVYAVYADASDSNPTFTVNGHTKKNINLYVHWMRENPNIGGIGLGWQLCDRDDFYDKGGVQGFTGAWCLLNNWNEVVFEAKYAHASLERVWKRVDAELESLDS